MFASTLATLVLLVPPTPDWLPTDLRQEYAYDIESVRKDKIEMVVIRRVRDDARIVVQCFDSNPELVTKPEKFNAEGPNFVRQPRDGFPFAVHYASNWTNKVAFSRATGLQDRVAINITGEYHRDGQFRGTEELPFHLDSKWIESLARQTYSAWAARRVTDSSFTQSIGGKSVKCYRSKSGQKLVDLTDLSQKANFSVNMSEDQSRCAFAFNDQNYIVPLGAMSIKRGSNWTALPDVVMSKNSRVLVPIEAFQ